MTPASEQKVAAIRKSIQRYTGLLTRAQKARNARLVAKYQRQIEDLRDQIRKIEQRERMSASGSRARPKATSLSRKRPQATSTSRKRPESVSMSRKRPVTTSLSKRRPTNASASDRRPPGGTADRYAGIQPTRNNATAMVAYYTMRLRNKLLGKGARAYFTARLAEARRVARSSGASGQAAGPLKKLAQMRRNLASRARARGDTASAAQNTAEAEDLEEQAKMADYQEPPEEWHAKAPPEYLAPREGDGAIVADNMPGTDASAAAAEFDDEVDADLTPWYARPVTWIIAGVAVVGAVVIARGRKGATGRTSRVIFTGRTRVTKRTVKAA